MELRVLRLGDDRILKYNRRKISSSIYLTSIPKLMFHENMTLILSLASVDVGTGR